MKHKKFFKKYRVMNTKKITAKKIRKPEPRMFERIEHKKTRREILDNYQ